jgi:hypothetical protein
MNANPATLAPDWSRTEREATAPLPAPVPEQTGANITAKVITAFRDIGIGADAKTAHARTKAWYRSSGGDWTQYLS